MNVYVTQQRYDEEQYINKIIHGDCLPKLKSLPDTTIDIILADPPYNCGKKYDGYSDDLPENEYWLFYENVFKECFRIMKDNTYCYVFSMSTQIFKTKNILESIGFRWIQLLIWYGPNMVGGTTSFRTPWSQMHEPISLFVKGKRKPMMNANKAINTHDVFVIARPQRNFKEGRHHICQKPLQLYKEILARTPGDIVLDPFGGSGTTALAALETGKKFICFEISENYVSCANKRVKDYLEQLRLFESL